MTSFEVDFCLMFPRAATTNYYKLNGLKEQNVFSQSSGY